MDNLFDGKRETIRLENGQSFGIPRRIYWALAQAAISAHEVGDIEPVLLEHLADNRPGCVCTLYGKAFAFVIQVEMETPPVVALSAQGLDDCRSRVGFLYGGDANSFDVWRKIVGHMLEAEGVSGATLEEIDEWNQEHGFI